MVDSNLTRFPSPPYDNTATFVAASQRQTPSWFTTRLLCETPVCQHEVRHRLPPIW